MDDPATLCALQNVGEGFHQLADDVLRHNYPRLRSLRPFGINTEGKPIKGTPDSYIGPNPADCTVAVEYGTWQPTKLKKKFLDDYRKVVKTCALAQDIFLCTNRPKDKEVEKLVSAEAKADGRTVTTLWGEDFARTLDDQRQDLRLKHLGIPIHTLTRFSLVRALEIQLDQTLRQYLTENERAAAASRLFRRPLESQFQRLCSRHVAKTLIVGDAGLGKTIWSAATARSLSSCRPVVWLPAKVIPSGGLDMAVVRSAYGASEPSKVRELASVLRTLGLALLLFVDALDEHPEYGRLAQILQDFFAHSAIALRCHVVLTCRTEAMRLFDDINANVFPPPAQSGIPGRLYLNALSESESAEMLQRLAVSPPEAAEIRRALPDEFYGNPLYLRLARQLQRVGDLPAESRSWVRTFADHYVKEISVRLRKDGTTPSRSAIEATLGRLAHTTLIEPQGADPDSVTGDALMSPGMAGEGTFVERAIQSGLLVRNGQRVRFCHALLCEYFAAIHLLSNSTNHADRVGLMATLPGRASVATFAALLDPSIVKEIAALHPAMLPPFEPSELDQPLTDSLVARARSLLESEYPSERSAGIHILTTLRTRSAVHASVDWFNSLEKLDKMRRLDDAAEIFLRLQIPGAVEIVATHWAFRSPDDLPWYDPDVARTLEGASIDFKKALADFAAAAVEQDTHRADEDRFTMILGYMRDQRLLERLRRKAALGPLTIHEHRALVHINTDEAIDVYLASREHYYRELEAIDGDEDKHNSKRGSLWERLVFHQADIVRFPHDALLRLVRRELRSADQRDVAFGMGLAALLRHADLVDDYALAMTARRKQGYFLFGETMIKDLVAGLAGDRVVQLYNDVSTIDAKEQVLASAGAVVSPLVEDMLLEALGRAEFYTSAVVALTELRSQRAGARLLDKLPGLSGYQRNITVKALGRIGFTPALESLLALLGASGVDTAEEYDLVRAIGAIGGRKAVEVLAERYRARQDDHILASLLDAGDEDALATVHDLLESIPETRLRLGRAIRFRDRLRDDVEVGIQDKYMRHPEFSDDRILMALIETATERLQAPKKGWHDLDLWYECTAIALFDAREAETFLRELASLEGSAEHVQRVVNFARRVLAHRGDRSWARFVVDEELDNMAPRDWASWDIRILKKWPRDVVREALLPRAAQEPERWLYLLATFADGRDRPFIADRLGSVNPNLADAIRVELVVSRGCGLHSC